ncbi:hypothetical protein Vadar_010559 [Vaccinium darrowii]|uniref:Uncharacterized protein n=1 Tax=Vaccinium darrowii TaxID=229202 RepID=A0ACB7XYI8_9ERIC|nr:hypothetical protein Vadar_010559 [Vaccinium darrowii]
MCLSETHIRKVLEYNLNHILRDGELKKIILKTGSREWHVPVVHGGIANRCFTKFLFEHKVSELDFIFVGVSHTGILQVIVFARHGGERMLEWRINGYLHFGSVIVFARHGGETMLEWFQMSKHICPVRDITIERKRYTIEAMVVEKGMPRTTSKIAKPYQRIVLQNAEGTRIQGTIGEDIAILSNTLKMFQTYSISNATVDKLDVQHRFVDHCFQLKISARTPIQAKLIDGLTIRTLKFNFTPIADIASIDDVDAKIDMLFAILEVGPRKPAGKSMIADLRIIDQGFVPTTVTLWDQFSDTEATAISNLSGPFPIAIAYRLKLAAKDGTNLGTRSSTTFVFNPPIPAAAALQAWCKANATAIKELPAGHAPRYQASKQVPPPDDKLVKIENFPASVEKPIYIGVKGTVQLVEFNQRFVYVACSVCNRGTNAVGDGEFWCNYCDKIVQPLTRVKFDVEIKDPTGQISAAMFAEEAEEFYKITSAEMMENIVDDYLQLAMMEKLNEPKECRVNLKVYNYSYGAIDQCKFSIVSIFHDTAESIVNAPRNPQLLAPTTPAKKAKISSYAKPSSPANNQEEDSDESATMQDASDGEDTDSLSKKND